MTTSIDEIRDVHKGQIRKGGAGAVLLGPEDADPIVSLTTGANAGLAEIPKGPKGYKSMGKHPRDGAPTFTSEQEQSEVFTWGELEASRIDAISKTSTIAWTCQDTRKSVLSAHTGVDLDNIELDPVTGELQIIEPTDPDIRYYRAIFITVDGRGENAYFIARYCPRFVITTIGEESWNAENPIVYPFTGRALVDDDLGYAVKRLYGGPAWKRGAQAAGFTLGSLEITTTALPGGKVGTAYSQTLLSAGGTASRTWSVTTGALPAGLALNAATGVISGTPTAAGTVNFTVQVVDDGSTIAQKALTIVVAA